MSGIARKLMGVTKGGASVIYAVTDTSAFPAHSSTSVSATQNLGTVYSDREVWVVVPTMGSSRSSEISNLTVGGNAATKAFELAASGYTNPVGVSYWRYIDNGSLGASTTIVATFGATQVHTGFVTFTAKANPILLDSYADSTNSNTPTTSSISTSASGWAFYCALSQNASAGVIANFDNNGFFDAGTNEWVVYGYNSPENGGSVLIGNPTNSGSGNRMISGISVRN